MLKPVETSWVATRLSNFERNKFGFNQQPFTWMQVSGEGAAPPPNGVLTLYLVHVVLLG